MHIQINNPKAMEDCNCNVGAAEATGTTNCNVFLKLQKGTSTLQNLVIILQVEELIAIPMRYLQSHHFI